MKLIGIVSNVILEEVRGRELDTPEDEQRTPNSGREQPTRDREEPTRDREQPTRDREQPTRDGEEIERRNREEIERRNREEIERRNREEIERRNREEVERRTRKQPREVNRNVEEPPNKNDQKTLKVSKNVEKQNDNSNLLKTPKFDTIGDVRDIKKVQTKNFIDSVVDKIEIQLKQQPAKVTQTLKKYNVDSKVMAKLAPLTKESFKTVMSLESNGVKLPLLILLFKNKNKLYNSMKTGKPLTKKDVSPAGGGINYNQFWKWSSRLENGWGKWLGDNVVKNFPEMSSLTLSF